MREMSKDSERPTELAGKEWHAYVCGDRKRQTVVIFMRGSCIELHPDHARRFAVELVWHADDVQKSSPTSEQL